MTTLNNSGEGGTNTTAVTTGNSGGSSGTAWDAVTVGSGGAAITYDNAHAYGSLAYKFVSGTSSTNVAWTSTSLGTLGEAWGRVYLYMAALPANSTGLVRLTNGAAQVARITISITGNVELRNAANTKLGQTATGVATGQWVRVEWHCIPLASNGTLEIRLFNSADSITADESTGFTNAALATNMTQVQYGPVNNAVAGTYWLDNLTATTLDWPGPIVQPVSPGGVSSGEQLGAHTVTPGPVTLSPSGLASGEAFGPARIGLAVTPAGIGSAETFGSTSVKFAALLPSGIASGESFGTPTISRGLGVLPSGIASGETFGAPSLTYAQGIAPAGLESVEAFGGAEIDIPQMLLPVGIASCEALGVAQLVQWVLHPPVVKEGPVADGPLFSRYKLYRGISIIQDADGSWRTARYPAQTELETARRVYMGGYTYPLTSDDRTMLIDAGFGDYIEVL